MSNKVITYCSSLAVACRREVVASGLEEQSEGAGQNAHKRGERNKGQ